MKTAAELRITPEEHQALILTKGVLAAEQVTFDMSVPCVLGYGDDGYEDEALRASYPCGTHLCIGGTMSILMQNDMVMPDLITRGMAQEADAFVGSHSDGPLGSLFYGALSSSITPAEGIVAIDRFLAGDARPWSLR